MVISIDHVRFYKTQNGNNSNNQPSEQFKLSEIYSVKSVDETIFCINVEDQNRQIRAKTSTSKSQWINTIEEHRLYKHIKIPVIIQCSRNNRFNHDFELIKPYNDKYEYYIRDLIADIMEKQHQQHKPYKFIPRKINSSSFIEQEINYDDYDWVNTFVAITDYPQDIVEENGINIEIDLAVYQHKPMTIEAKCTEMKNDHQLCPIYA